MKRIYLLTMMFLTVLVTSCDSIKPESLVTEVDGYGVIEVEFSFPETKSTVAFDYEKTINDIQILVFNEDGNLLVYATEKVVEGILIGNCEVWAVVNGPDCSRVKTKQELMEREVLLSDNSTDPAKGFVMRGSRVVTIQKDKKMLVPITLERLVSRIYVNNITYDCPEQLGDVVVKGVFLANAVGNENIAGTALPTLWYNKYGRPTGVEDEFIDGVNVLAEVADMTWREVDRTISKGTTENLGACVYGFKNNVTEFPSFSDSFTQSGSVLYVVTLIQGQLRCFHINLDSGLFINSSCSLGLEILGYDDEFRISIIVSPGNIIGYTSITGGNFYI